MAEKEKMTFEQATQRLDELVKKMESGTLPLDDMVAAFEEGNRLISFCSKKLNDVERRVELLTQQTDGSVSAEPFEEKE